MFIGEKPKTLEECFERLKKGCQRLSDECGYSDDYSVFNEPATEEEIKRYEERHNIVLPEDYKKFLRFSNGAEIMGTSMTIYGLNYCGISDEMVPEYYCVIGEQIGDGERIAFDPETKEIFSFYNGKITPWLIEDEMKTLLDHCEGCIWNSEFEKNREKRRKMGITPEQERNELHNEIADLYKEYMKRRMNKESEE